MLQSEATGAFVLRLVGALAEVGVRICGLVLDGDFGRLGLVGILIVAGDFGILMFEGVFDTRRAEARFFESITGFDEGKTAIGASVSSSSSSAIVGAAVTTSTKIKGDGADVTTSETVGAVVGPAVLEGADVVEGADETLVVGDGFLGGLWNGSFVGFGRKVGRMVGALVNGILGPFFGTLSIGLLDLGFIVTAADGSSTSDCANALLDNNKSDAAIDSKTFIFWRSH